MANLMVDKKITSEQLASACVLGAGLVGGAVFALSWTTNELETHFHIFHRNPAATPSAPPSGTLLFALIALYPLVTIVTLVLVIPLLMYVTDHTPFQSLNPLRPDHFARLVVRVYTAWLSNPGGKMKAKDQELRAHRTHFHLASNTPVLDRQRAWPAVGPSAGARAESRVVEHRSCVVAAAAAAAARREAAREERERRRRQRRLRGLQGPTPHAPDAWRSRRRE